MTSAILSLVRPLVKPAAKSVDGVLGAFKTAIDDLAKVKEQSLQTAQDLEQQALAANINARAAREEAARAEEVSGKLRSLINA
jgi:Sec-independent protein translocase protein TatA